jgi:RNA polymerase sigma factor (sigma-70 family)
LADDKEIMRLCSDEHTREEGFVLLVKTYQQRLYWHLRRMVIYHDDADDVLQECWIKAWRGLDSFRQESQLYTWLYRIATNEALSHLKKVQRNTSLPFEAGGEELGSLIDSAPLVGGDEISRKLQKAILILPAKQRLVFNMKYFDDMKYNDMSEVLGTSVGGLKASYHLAVKKIEKHLMMD